MAENSAYNNSTTGAVPRYDNSKPSYNNDAYSQMFQGASAYGNQKKTGFRQEIPKALSDAYYDIPEYKIGTLNYKPADAKKTVYAQPAPLTEIDNQNPDNSSEQAQKDANLNRINDYNNSINTFGSGSMTTESMQNPVGNPTDFYGNSIEKKVNSPKFNPLAMLSVLGIGTPIGTGAGIANTIIGQGKDAVPSEGYGAYGTYSGLTGNKFDASGRGYDPSTGQYKQEYATQKAWSDKMGQDPLDNIFGDVDVATQGKLTDSEFADARADEVSIKYGHTDPMGNPMTTGLTPAGVDAYVTQNAISKGATPYTVQKGTDRHKALVKEYYADKKDQPEFIKEVPAPPSYGPPNVLALAPTPNVSDNSSDDNNGNFDSGDNAGFSEDDYSDAYSDGFADGGKIPPLTYANEGKYIGQPTGKQTIVGRDIYSSPITGPMGNLVGSENASERGSTIEMDGQYGNIPSVYGGRQYNEDQLFEMMKRKDNPIPRPNAYYDDPIIATEASKMRSRALDGQNVMGMEHTQRLMQDPFGEIFRRKE